jgi:DNA-binding GntR family transcriptional regulator
MKDISVAARTASASKSLTTRPDIAPPAAGESARYSLSDLARDRFMQAMFDYRIAPGAFVSQGELARLLGVPVGPLRDALRTLQAEGWLTIHARSGIALRKPDFPLVRNSYQFRLIIERAAVRIFAEMAPIERIDAIEQRHREAMAQTKTHDLTPGEAQAMEAVDFGFHLEVVSILSNPLIEAAYRQAQGFVQLTRLDREFKLSAPLLARTMTEHLDIIAACRRRDPQGAETALEVHFARAMQRAIGFF